MFDVRQQEAALRHVHLRCPNEHNPSSNARSRRLSDRFPFNCLLLFKVLIGTVQSSPSLLNRSSLSSGIGGKKDDRSSEDVIGVQLPHLQTCLEDLPER
eukprot:scaffold5_cov331-Pavlova_lutheri.AAC.37